MTVLRKMRLTALLAASIGAGVGMLQFSASSVASGKPTGKTAKVLSVHETAHLRLVNSRGLTINDRGNASGTFNCPMVIHFTIESATRGSASFTAYPSGGSISGRARASYSVSGTTGHFEGSMTITSGTGSFGHATGKGLLIKGTIDRYNYSLVAQLSGQVHL